MQYEVGDKIKLVSKEKLLKLINQKKLDKEEFDELGIPELTEMLGKTVEVCTFWEDENLPLELWNQTHNETWWFHEIAVETSCIQT